MKHLCEHYVYEKLEKARKYTEEAAREEAAGRHKDAAHLLKQAAIQARSAQAELSRNDPDKNIGTIVDAEDEDEIGEQLVLKGGSSNPLGGLPDEQQAGYIA